MSPIDDSLIAEILIVGGGLVGLTLAISAAQSGFRVVVIDWGVMFEFVAGLVY